MDDLISRQDAINSIESHIRTGDELYLITETDKILNHAFEISASCIYNMPSAEPEIIRCKDCKYFEQYTDDGTFESVLKMHQWDGECSEWVGHTYMGWFCSRAKRRIDG